MFDRCTDAARRAYGVARNIALEQGSRSVHTVHLLAAIAEAGDPISELLIDLGLSRDAILAGVGELPGSPFLAPSRGPALSEDLITATRTAGSLIAPQGSINLTALLAALLEAGDRLTRSAIANADADRVELQIEVACRWILGRSAAGETISDTPRRVLPAMTDAAYEALASALRRSGSYGDIQLNSEELLRVLVLSRTKQSIDDTSLLRAADKCALERQSRPLEESQTLCAELLMTAAELARAGGRDALEPGDLLIALLLTEEARVSLSLCELGNPHLKALPRLLAEQGLTETREPLPVTTVRPRPRPVGEVPGRERLTGPAREAIDLAGYFAERLHHPTISELDLFLGIKACEPSIGGRLLSEYGYKDRAIAAAMATAPSSDAEVGPPPASRRVAMALRLADDAAVDSDTLIGTEHLLLALLSLASSQVRVLLEESGIDIHAFEASLVAQLGQEPTGPEPPVSFEPLESSQPLDPAAADEEPSELLRALGISLADDPKSDYPALAIAAERFFGAAPPSPAHRREPVRIEACRDLTALAALGELPAAHTTGATNAAIRERLECSRPGVTLLVGESPWMLDDAVRSIAGLMHQGLIGPPLADAALVELDLVKLVSACTARGQFEERVRRLLIELEAAAPIVLVIPNLDRARDLGRVGVGGHDLLDLLRPRIECGDLTVLATATSENTAKRLMTLPDLRLMLKVVPIPRPTREQTLAIVMIERERAGCASESDLLPAIVELTGTRRPDLPQPEAALRLLSDVISAGRRRSDEARPVLSQVDLAAALESESALWTEAPSSPVEDSWQATARVQSSALERGLVGDAYAAGGKPERTFSPEILFLHASKNPHRPRLIELLERTAYRLNRDFETVGSLQSLDLTGPELVRLLDADRIVVDLIEPDPRLEYLLGLLHGRGRCPLVLVRDRRSRSEVERALPSFVLSPEGLDASGAFDAVLSRLCEDLRRFDAI